LPLSIAILIGLFAMQARGTAKVAALFGPIILVWFRNAGRHRRDLHRREPRVLAAFNPTYGVNFSSTTA
jgi:KUP system potassium uptake protein